MGWLDGKQIVDALYGNSYDPLIQKIYKGDELIFERNSWDYILENADFDGTDNTLIYVPINIFSPENIVRDWEFFINGSTIYSAENQTTFGIIGADGGSPPGTVYYVEVGMRPTGLYLYRYGDINGTNDKVWTCDCMNKDIHIVKTGLNIEFYVDDALIHTFVLKNYTGNSSSMIKIMVGGWWRGAGHQYFNGHLNYYKFRFTS